MNAFFSERYASRGRLRRKINSQWIFGAQIQTPVQFSSSTVFISAVTKENMKTDRPNPLPEIARSPKESSDYEPDWRRQCAELYRLKIEQADDPNQKVAEIWAKEPDELVLQLVLFHLNGPCLMRGAIHYAVNCWRSNFKTGIASRIKAMVVADFLEEEIAIEFGTETHNISLFEYLFFDARQYRRHRGWLKTVCFRRGEPTVEARTESRLLQLAIRRGKQGVREALLDQVAASEHTRCPNALKRLARNAADRAAEYYLGLDASGEPPSPADFKVLRDIAHLEKVFGLPIFEETSASKTTPCSESAKVRLERLEAIDWETLNLRSASDVAEMTAYFNKAALKALALRAEAETDADASSFPLTTTTGAKRISWRKVISELKKLGIEAA